MIFTSLSYLFFLSLAAAAYYLFPGRWRWVWLVMASVAYYLSFIPIFFALTGVLVIGNYFGGRWISKAHEGARGKKVLIVVIVLNVLALAFFKYFHYFFPGRRVDLYFVDWFYRVDPITRMIIPLGLSYLIFTVRSHQLSVISYCQTGK